MDQSCWSKSRYTAVKPGAGGGATASPNPSSGVSLPARKHHKWFAHESGLSTGHTNHKRLRKPEKHVDNVQPFSPVEVEKPKHGILFKAERSLPLALRCHHVKSLRGRVRRSPGEGPPVTWSVFLSIIKCSVAVALGGLRVSDSVRERSGPAERWGAFLLAYPGVSSSGSVCAFIKTILFLTRWFSLSVFSNSTSYYRETSWVQHTVSGK